MQWAEWLKLTAVHRVSLFVVAETCQFLLMQSPGCVLLSVDAGVWSPSLCYVWQTYTYKQLKAMVETRNFAPDVDRESLEVLHAAYSSHIVCFFHQWYSSEWPSWVYFGVAW